MGLYLFRIMGIKGFFFKCDKKIVALWDFPHETKGIELFNKSNPMNNLQEIIETFYAAYKLN